MILNKQIRVLKLKIRIQTFIVFYLFGNAVFGQVVNLGGLDININDITINRPLCIEDKSTTDEDELVTNLISKSNNKKYFTKARNIQIVDKDIEYFNLVEEKCILELYDSNSNLLWSKKIDKMVAKCKISDDGKLCHVTVYETEEMDLNYYLITLNEFGYEIYQEDDVSDIYPNSNNDVIYYTKRIENIKYLLRKDFSGNNTWKQQMCEDCTIGTISEEGDNILICSSSSGLYSMDKYGRKIWSNPSRIGGQASLSPKGDYLLKGFKLFNNRNGEFLFSLEESEFNEKKIDYIDGCFVKNGDNKIVVVGWCGSRQNRIKTISIFDIKGNLLRNLSFNERFEAFMIDCRDNGDSTFDLYLYNKFIKRIHYEE